MNRWHWAEEARVTKKIGRGSRQGSSWFGRLGDIAQQPPVWAGVAGLLALTGPRGRRAALRGSVCYATASLIHVMIKPFVARKRPLGAGLTRLGPATSSFPSGHAASDLAFALAASQEMPLLFLPLSGVTTAAHWSLVRSRGHYPTDVLAGGVIGAVVAAVAWKLWPPTDGPDPTEAREQVDRDTGP